MTDANVTLKVANIAPLLANEAKQSLYLTVTSDGYQNITLSGQLGEGAADLMTVTEFNKLKKNINLTPRSNATMSDPSVIKLKWLIDITFKAKKPWQIQLNFENFTASTEGKTTIEVKEKGKNDLLRDVNVTKTKITSRIKSFVSDKYNFTSNGNKLTAGQFKLSWEIDPESSDLGLELYEKKIGPSESKIDISNTARSVTLNVDRETEYRLKLTTGAGQSLKSLDERRLRIHAFSQNTFVGYSPPLAKPGGGIFGFYAHQGSATLREAFLLALLQDGPNEPSASLWKTNQGFDAGEWKQVGQNVSIPLDAARRPGIIFKDKFWLVGGDCSSADPRREGFNVSWCNLTTDKCTFFDFVREGIPDDKWPPDRMGHALVKRDEGHLWVMGGFAQDGGARNDIWEFDGQDWTKLAVADPLWAPRCLFGATATSDAIWIAGGFDSPGAGTSYDDIWRYDKKNSKWGKLINTIRPGNGEPQYCACTLFTLYDNPCAITTYNWPSTGRILHHLNDLKPVGVGGSSWVNTPYLVNQGAFRLFPSNEYYRLDSAVFGGAAFFRYLAGNVKIMGTDITYFVAPFAKGA
jgi:hypothetical protein